MIGIILYVEAFVFVVLAVVCVRGAANGLQRLSAQHEAWIYRERLAKLVHQIEADEFSPPRLRSLAAFLADRAFDEKFMREIASSPSVPSDVGDSLKSELVAECGVYASLALKALELYATALLVVTDRKHHLRLRAQRLRQYDQQQVLNIEFKLKNIFAPKQSHVGVYDAAFGS